MHGFRFAQGNSAPPRRAAYYLNQTPREIERRVAGSRPCELRSYAESLRLAAAEVRHSRPLWAQLFQDIAVIAEATAAKREQRRRAGQEQAFRQRMDSARTTFRPDLTGLAHFGRR